jgi:hypothetical protein
MCVRALALAMALAWAGRAHAATSLESLSIQIVNQLGGALPTGAQVAIGKVVTDQPIARESALATRIAEHLASRIKGSTIAEDVRDATAARLARRATVFLSPQLRVGVVSVAAQVFVPSANVWTRARERDNALTAQAVVFAPADVELRQYLEPILLERLKLSSFAYEPFGDGDPPLAIACGDLNGRGTLAVVSRREVRTGYLAQGRVHWDKKVKWIDIARRTPVPLREPIATAILNGSLWVGSSDRGGAVYDGASWKAIDGLPVVVDQAGDEVWCATPRPSEHALSGDLTNCRGVQAPLVLPAHDAQVWQVGERVFFRRAGGELSIRDVHGAVIEFEGSEAATLGDLDQDGRPDVLFSTIAPTSLRVAVVDGKNALLKLQLPAPRPVLAMAACPAEAEARPSALAITASEVLRVR